MGIVFGSLEARVILEQDRKNERRIANIQAEYKEALDELDYAEIELKDARSRFDECQKALREIELFVERHGIQLED